MIFVHLTDRKGGRDTITFFLIRINDKEIGVKPEPLDDDDIKDFSYHPN